MVITMSKTIKEIAKELNISTSTVSRVFNNKSNVNEKTRRKVLDALKKSGYLPNQLARSLKMQSTKTVGIVIPDVCERFFGQIIKGIDSLLVKEGYSIFLVDTNESRENEEKYLDMLYQQQVAGLVMATVNADGKKILDFIDNYIPVVFIDNLPNIDRQFDAVLIDNVYASRHAVQHLIRKGHRDIAVIIGSPHETTGHDRLLGYRSAMKDAGIQLNENLIKYGDYKERSGYNCMNDLLKQRNNDPFSAVFVTSEMMTYGAIKSIRKHGLRFPDDIALIGFDVYDKTGLVHPEITTIRQPEKQIGNLTAEILLRKMKYTTEQIKETQGQKTLLRPYLDEKDSC